MLIQKRKVWRQSLTYKLLVIVTKKERALKKAKSATGIIRRITLIKY